MSSRLVLHDEAVFRFLLCETCFIHECDARIVPFDSTVLVSEGPNLWQIRTNNLLGSRQIEKLIEQHRLQEAWPISIPILMNVNVFYLFKDPAGSDGTDTAATSQNKSIRWCHAAN